VFDGLDTVRHGFHQGHKTQVKKQHLVFGVVGNPHQLVRMQTWVEGVQYRARAGHRVIQLHVTVAVPGQGANAVTKLQLKRFERIGHPAGALAQLAKGLAVNVTLDTPGHDFLIAMVAFSVNQQVGNQQRLLLHACFHNVSSTASISLS